MKKLITIFLAIVLVMSLVACNHDSGVEPIDTPTTTNSNETNTTEDTNENQATNADETESHETIDSTASVDVGETNTTNPIEMETIAPTEAETIRSTVPDELTVPTKTEEHTSAHIHQYTDSVTRPTCMKDGYTTHICDCGDSYVDTKVPASGHSFGAWQTVKEPTTISTGLEERVCATCNTKETKTLGKLTEAHTHQYTGKVTKAATCSNEGIKTFTCSCGDQYTERIVKTAHKYTDTVTKPTCTEGGYTQHTCSVCKHLYTDNKTKAAGHSFSVVSNTATCEKGGTKTEKCSTCGEKKTSSSKATGHVNTETESKAATCLVAGYEKVICADCGAVVSETTIPSNGQHSYKTVRLSDAAQETWDHGYFDYVKYINYTDWNVEMCESCLLVDEDSIRFAYSDYEAAVIMLGYVNDLRESVYGTDEYNLTLSESLLQLAKLRAQDISIDFSHNGMPCAENIACGQTGIYAQFLDWKNSSGHYQNMISKTRTKFGYAIYYDAYSHIYGVQLFQ